MTSGETPPTSWARRRSVGLSTRARPGAPPWPFDEPLVTLSVSGSCVAPAANPGTPGAGVAAEGSLAPSVRVAGPGAADAAGAAAADASSVVPSPVSTAAPPTGARTD